MIKVSLFLSDFKWKKGVFWQKIDTTQNSHYHENNVISDVAAGGGGCYVIWYCFIMFLVSKGLFVKCICNNGEQINIIKNG